MAAFDNVRLPVDVEIGAEGGPTFSTGIITTASGQEQRIQNWSKARNSYTIGYGCSETDWQAIRAFFYARRGRARGFRFKDWTDFKVQGELVTNNGTFLQLAKTYADDIGIAYMRQITRVVPGTLKLYDDNGTDVTAMAVESYGKLTFANHGQNKLVPDTLVGNLYADFEYDLPVRFDVDDLVLTAETIQAVTIDTIKLVELIENTATLNGM